MQSCLCTAQVRCDVVSFGTISVRYVQLVKNNLVHAYRASVSIIQYVYAFRSYFSDLPTAVRYANKCCVTSHATSTSLLGTFQASYIGEWYTKNFSGVALSYQPHLIFGESSPLSIHPFFYRFQLCFCLSSRWACGVILYTM